LPQKSVWLLQETLRSRTNRTTMPKIVVRCLINSRSSSDARFHRSTMLEDRTTICNDTRASLCNRTIYEDILSTVLVTPWSSC